MHEQYALFYLPRWGALRSLNWFAVVITEDATRDLKGNTSVVGNKK